MTVAPAGSSGVHARSDEWFTRAKASLLGALPCRQGCCRCCLGPFAITMLDVMEIRRGLRTLPPEVREDIEIKARRQAAEMEAAFPRLKDGISLDAWRDADVDQLTRRFRDVRCPALHDDGSCRIYPFRPVTCRVMGIPVEAGERVVGACEVQTAIPIRRISAALREEESRLADREEAELTRLRRVRPGGGDEVLLPYGFLKDRIEPPR